MVSKKALLGCALLGATAYVVANNWDDVRAALGIGDPVELRAVRIAKSGFSLATHSTNHKVVHDRVVALEGAAVVGWRAARQTESLYLVSFVYQHEGKRRGFHFEVNVGSTAVRYIGTGSDLGPKYRATPSPR